MRDSAMIYRNQADALRELPPEQFKAIVLALWDYELDGVVPEGDSLVVAMWKMVQPLIDKRTKNYENGTLGGRPKKPIDNRIAETENRNGETENRISDSQNRNTETENLKNKEERINIKEIPSKEGTKKSGFTPPTLQEVQEYIKGREYNIDPERFIDFYASKGWYVGKNKMKDWKAAVRNWARSQRQEVTANGKQEMTAKRPETTVNRFNNFQQRNYDFDDLERKLTGRVT